MDFPFSSFRIIILRVFLEQFYEYKIAVNASIKGLQRFLVCFEPAVGMEVVCHCFPFIKRHESVVFYICKIHF